MVADQYLYGGIYAGIFRAIAGISAGMICYQISQKLKSTQIVEKGKLLVGTKIFIFILVFIYMNFYVQLELMPVYDLQRVFFIILILCPIVAYLVMISTDFIINQVKKYKHLFVEPQISQGGVPPCRS